MKGRSALFLLTAGLVLGLVAPAFALFTPPPPPGTFVYDGAGMLDGEAKARLEELLGEFSGRRGIQFVVATFPALDGDVLEEASLRVAEQWKIGRKGSDSGLLLIIFKEDRVMRFEVGYGLEGTMTDATCGKIIRKVITPRFKAGDFSGGISAGVHAAADVLVGANVDFGADEDAQADSTKLAVTILQILIFGVILWSAMSRSRRGGRYYGGGYWGGGGGGWSGGGGSSGGFSGGGGGFGGGGASGRW